MGEGRVKDLRRNNKKKITDEISTRSRGGRPKKTHKQNIRVKRRRKPGFGLIVTALSVMLFCVYIIQNLFFIQIIEHENHISAAASNHYKRIVELPLRGSIYDRNGNELAVSISVETIGITPVDVRSLRYPHMGDDEIAYGIARALNLDYEEVLEKMQMKEKAWVLLKKRISREESVKLKEFRSEHQIGGIKIDTEDARIYPMGNTAGTVIGFVNPDGIGQSGLEYRYNSHMTGEPGYTYAETDNYGQSALPFSVPISLRARHGYNIVSTVDAGIQRILEDELRKAVEIYGVEDGGVAIVMDPYTGSILGMADTPGFDPSNPAGCPPGFDIESWDPSKHEHMEYLQKNVWRNKSISNTYEPGSTFKTITAAIAMEEGKFFEEELISNAPIEVAGWKIENILWRYHGLTTSEEAFWRSSNPAFVRISQRVGVSTFYNYVRSFGFKNLSGVDLPGEAEGLFHDDPKEIDMACLAFGQQSTVTPLSMLTAYSAFANGGYLMKPRTVSRITDSDGNVVEEVLPETVRQVVSEKTAGRVMGLLEGAVLHGTGISAYVEGYNVGGKTSTSTRIDDKTDISFLAIAPVRQPKIAILVVLFAPEEDHSRSAVTAGITGIMIERILEYLCVPREYTEDDLSNLKKTFEVPDLKGMNLSQASIMLRNKGFLIDPHLKDFSEENTVLYQMPEYGSKLRKGGTVAVYFEENPDIRMTVVPDVIGKNLNECISALTEAGINIIINGELTGVAVKQEYDPGKTVEYQSKIEIEFESLSDG